jgi:hypothetical protein
MVHYRPAICAEESRVIPVVVQFDKQVFPRGLKPCQFTALIGAETQD